MTLWIGQEGVEKKTQKKQKRGLLRARPQALKPQPCYYCTSAEKRSQTGAAARGAPLSLLTFTSVLVILEVNWACVLLCRSRRGEDRAVTVVQQKGRQTWTAAIEVSRFTQRVVFILPSGPPGKFLLKSSEVIIMMWRILFEIIRMSWAYLCVSLTS